jgi:GTPase Era involved in 16S rRNA processing
MGAPHNRKIPILTDVISPDGPNADAVDASSARSERDIDAMIAELQTNLAAKTFALADELMQTAFADMEAKIREQISARLRRELPELIDSLLREYWGREER